MDIKCSFAKMVDPQTLILHDKNPNHHSKEQIDRLAKLIKFQGARHPIIVSRKSGKIVAGHGRLMAMKQLGWKQVPVDYQDFKSNEEEYAFLVSDNAISEWADLDLSAINHEVLNLPDFDIDLLGIEDFKIVEPVVAQCDEDEVPESAPAVTVLGDIYELGNHRLMCGDSTSIDAVEKLMNGEKADITFTSPPYNLGKSVGLRNGAFKGKSNAYENHDDEMDSSDYLGLLKTSVSNAILVSKYQAINIQWLAGNKTSCIEWLNHFKDNFVDVLIWAKTNPPPAMAPQVVTSGFEFIFIFSNEINPKRTIKTATFIRGSFNNVFNSAVGSNSHTEGTHGATFPVSLAEHYISNLSEKSVLDLFGGSGSTLIACEKTQRKCFMMEIDPHYCDVIVSRWCKYTGNNKIKRNGEEIEWQIS